jgi:hypothetical protein
MREALQRGGECAKPCSAAGKLSKGPHASVGAGDQADPLLGQPPDPADDLLGAGLTHLPVRALLRARNSDRPKEKMRRPSPQRADRVPYPVRRSGSN